MNKVDAGGYTALIHALFHAYTSGNYDTVKLLVSLGAKVNVTNRSRETPLMLVSGSNKNLEMVKLFLEKGAKVNPVDLTGKSALMYAVKGRADEIVDLLIEKGADVHAKTKEGQTAL